MASVQAGRFAVAAAWSARGWVGDGYGHGATLHDTGSGNQRGLAVVMDSSAGSIPAENRRRERRADKSHYGMQVQASTQHHYGRQTTTARGMVSHTMQGKQRGSGLTFRRR